jgi:GntR family transcriptional regulator
VAEDLRGRLERGEWNPSERLPGEHDLAAHYGVSRATVRTALRDVEARGLTVTLHGQGTYATAASKAVPADLRRLESISASIVRMDRRPGTEFRSIAVRHATTREVAALELLSGALVMATQREITADDELIAYSHDVIPRAVLADDFDVRTVGGSLFTLLDHHGVDVTSALTGIHASTGDEIGWGSHPPGTLFVLLEQTHFDARSRAVAYSRTWFIEGRFQFNLVRVR